MPRIYDYRTGYFYNQHVFGIGFKQDTGLTAQTVIADCTTNLFWGLVGGTWMWIVSRA